MDILQHSPSNTLSLDETLAALAASDTVDGLALFGSRAAARDDPVSDYDLLVLVTQLPLPIFQMFTHIAGRMADVVFLDTATVDTVLQAKQPVSMTSFEGMQLQKMLKIQIEYDPSGRLTQLKDYARQRQTTGDLYLPADDGALYETRFWLNHGLCHMKRMIQSDDEVYLIAVDMMLLGSVSSICRDYHKVRGIPWQGEKAAVRYLQAYDPAYLEQLRTCIAASDRQDKLALYEQLVTQTLAPVDQLWRGDITAIYLRGAEHTPANLDNALRFWQGLFGADTHP